MPQTILNSIAEIDAYALELARSMPVPMNKESDAQKAAQQQQNLFNQTLMQTFQTQFAESQDILRVLTPQLEAMAKSPEGFGAAEYAALQSQIINNVGAQYSSVAKQAAQEFATTNEAGLPSGVEAQVQGQIAAGAAGAEAGNLTQLNIANEQLKNQQRQFALSSLAGESGTLSGQSASFSGQAGQGLQNAFQNATTVYNQGSLWQNILSGVAGVGLDFATGGLSSVMQGNSFLEGGASAVLNPGGK